MNADERIASYLDRINARRQQRRDAADARHRADLHAADSDHARAIQSLQKLQANPDLLELFDELRALHDELHTPASHDGESLSAENVTSPASWPGLRNVIRRFARSNPRSVSVAKIMEYAEHEFGPGKTTRKAVVSEVYKMAHDTKELVVETPGTGNKPGTWRASEQLRKEETGTIT